MHICMDLYVCMHGCRDTCIYVCMDEYMQDCMYVCMYTAQTHTYILLPGTYYSIATAILSQNHKGIDITESILVSIKVIIAFTNGFSQ